MYFVHRSQIPLASKNNLAWRINKIEESIVEPNHMMPFRREVKLFPILFLPHQSPTKVAESKHLHQPDTEDLFWASHSCNPRPSRNNKWNHIYIFCLTTYVTRFSELTYLDESINRARNKKLSIWREPSALCMTFGSKLQYGRMKYMTSEAYVQSFMATTKLSTDLLKNYCWQYR